MLFAILAPALVAASTCSNTVTDNDDHEYLLQSSLVVTEDQALASLREQHGHGHLNKKLKDAQAYIAVLKEKLAVYMEAMTNMNEATAASNEAEAANFELEQLTTKLEAAEMHEEILLKELQRVSKAKNQEKAKMLQSKMEDSWKQATEATEAALVAEREAESRRQQAEKAATQNAAQRDEAAALREAETARRDHVMALRELRHLTNATWNLKDEHAVKDIAEAENIVHVKHVKHAKAKVIKTRRASQRAENHAAELSAKAANMSAQAWMWKQMYKSVHPKAIKEKKALVATKAEVIAVEKEKANLIAEQKQLEVKKTELDGKVSELIELQARAQAVVL